MRERNKKKEVKKAAAFRHYLVFLYFSYLVFCHGVFWSNDTQPTKPNQTKQPTTFCDDDVQILLYTINYKFEMSLTLNYSNKKEKKTLLKKKKKKKKKKS